jgi:hypothetical protein
VRVLLMCVVGRGVWELGGWRPQQPGRGISTTGQQADLLAVQVAGCPQGLQQLVGGSRHSHQLLCSTGLA